ncbi:phage major capsid protein [Microvirga subterranea]|uniref:HK97 family phage major capsid protein n=1 Tax=Microvirga subterranea TaxID=186651 RepID=A0A370HA13_9HYPH|nr:phage major capsid protein [Microvirga subterranea]RDI51225.1 HK97 family phage major capsid protein [Microvirga subterranea]
MKHFSTRALETKSAALEIKEEGGPDDVPAAIAALQATFEEKMAGLQNEVKAAKDRADELETKLNRPGTGSTKTDDDQERKAFESFLRRGIERMPADEVKTLTVANDPSAGYLAPETIGAELFKDMVEFSPIRNYARVVQITGPEIRYPRRVSGTTAYWVDEIEDRTASEPVFDQMSLTPWELATFTEVSNQLLEDNAYNLEEELRLDYAESFGKKEGAAFVAGTGTKQPRGILTATGIPEIITGKADGFAATDPADAIVKAYYALPSAYAQRGAWLMNRNTMGIMSQWKDGQGRYLLMNPVTEGTPSTLLGRPVIEAVDMPDVAAGAFPIVFGDWSGYRIVDRIGLSVLRDPYTRARNGITTFHARKRVGGDVTHPDRFVKVKVAAS